MEDLVMDNKPLLTILGPQKSLPTLAAARLQRWAVFLHRYQHDLEFTSIVMSRLPRKYHSGEAEELDFRVST